MNPTMALMLSASIQAERLAAANRQFELRAARAPKMARAASLAIRVLKLRPA